MQEVDPRVYRLVLGKVVAALRGKRGFSQEDFASSIGVSQPTLSRIERGRSMPDHLTMRRIATAFGMSVDQLDHYIDQTIARTRKAAEGTTERKKGVSALKTALAVAGIVGLSGLIGYVVAALIAEEDDEE